MNKNNDYDIILKKVETLKKENKKLKEELKKSQDKYDYMEWYYGNELEKINFVRFARLNARYVRQNGIFKFIFQIVKSIGKIFQLLYFKINKKIKKRENIKILSKILSENKGKEIFVFYPGYDWYMKMYQRPQHMAMHFSDRNILFFYCTGNFNDNIVGFKKIKDGLFVTDQYELLKSYLPQYTLYMYANENGCYIEELKQIQAEKNNILYEYIDDLHEDITTIPQKLIDRHNYVLKNDKIPVIVTAQHLYKKAKKIRGSSKNILESTNGVVYEDFHITGKLPIPENIKSFVQEGKKIIGYYGALAKWFDYELIEKIAKKHPDWNILLIGIDYDNSFAKYNYFKNYDNILYIGPVDYKELIKYGNCCNVLTIPFIINEITLSTSPVKVFEYMTMEKPIVTTDLPECRKYKSVLIAKNHEEFIKLLELAITKENDEEYKKILRKEALENTWTSKVDEILDFIK